MKNRLEITNYLRELSKSEETTLTLTSLLIELNEVLKNPDTEAVQVAAIISRDPMLTAAILKAANSSYFGLIKQVTSVRQAVSIMGFTNVQKYFTVKFMDKVFNCKKEAVCQDLWKHSLATAVACEALSPYVNAKMKEVLFSAGIMHDLGSFIIYNYLPEESEQVLKILANDPDRRLIIAEKEVLGITHQEIGAFFAKEWNFPEIIIDCIKQHHFISDSNYKEYIAVVMLANNIAKAMELGRSENYLVTPMPKYIWGMLGIPDRELSNIVDKVQQEFEKIQAEIF